MVISKKRCIFAKNKCMKRTFLIIILGLLGYQSVGQDTIRMTLDSCLSYAYQHNIAVREAQLNQASTQVLLDRAKMQFLPSINAGASENWGFQDGAASRNGNYGVNAGLTLFGGLSRMHNYRQNEINLEQSDLRIRQSFNAISNQIVSAYLTILMNQEKLNFQKQVLKTSKQQAEEGILKYDVGKILESDYQLLTANYGSATSNIENTQLTIESNRMALRSLLCVEASGVVDVVANDVQVKAEACTIPILDTVMQRSLRNLPDLAISEMDIDKARYNVKMAQSAYMPNLGLNAGISYYEGQAGQVDGQGTVITHGGMNSSVGVSLNIPILNQGNTRTQIKQSKLELEQAQLQYDQKKIDIEQEIESQYITTQQALNQFKACEMMEKAYKASYDVYVMKYAEGAITTVEMLQQQDKYLNALNDYLQSKYAFLLAQRTLKIYMGEW